MREITIHNFANTGPVINWLKLPNSNEKLLTLVSAINTPAIAAAFVIKSYSAKANDEISLQFGDLISVIDMPSSKESIWWRGKRGFEVGFFPSSCVELIKDRGNFLNSNNLKSILKQHTGSLQRQHKKSNNENKNPLNNFYENECSENIIDKEFSICSITTEKLNNNSNQNFNVPSSNKRESLNNCQKELVSIENQLHTTPKLNLHSNSSNDHYTQSKTQQSSLKSSFRKKYSITNTSSAMLFPRKHRISSTLPKSLTNSNTKPVCINLFNNNEFNKFDSLTSTNSSDRVLCDSLNSNKVDQQQNFPSNINQQSPTNKRGKLTNFLRSIINRNSNHENNQLKNYNNDSILNKRKFSTKNEEKNSSKSKSNVLSDLSKNKNLVIKNIVFGCDLEDHLKSTGFKIPLVLKSCCDFLERNGIVHGIYRLSGVNSNIQKLIKCFDENKSPDFDDDTFLQDVHCVSSLLKLYFRELPNPLLTFELYDNFVKAIQPNYSNDPSNYSSQNIQEELSEETKLDNLTQVLKQLPLNHYITLEYLIKHLNKISTFSEQTGMTIKNLAIIWAPNLLKSKELESKGGFGALQCIAIQAVLTEYLIRFVDKLFNQSSRPSFYKEENSNELKEESISSESLNTTQNTEDFKENLELSDEYQYEENKFPITNQFSNLITLQEAQNRWKEKKKSFFNKETSFDEGSSTFMNKEKFSSNNDDEINDVKDYDFRDYKNLKKVYNNNFSDDSQIKKNSEENLPRFGILGQFDSFKSKNNFGNLNLNDNNSDEETQYEILKAKNLSSLDESLGSKEKIFFKTKNFEANNSYQKPLYDNFFGNKSFDESSDDNFDKKSNSSLKYLNKLDNNCYSEGLQRYHTILNPKHFRKNKVSPTKSQESNLNLFKRTSSKWKPCVKL